LTNLRNLVLWIVIALLLVLLFNVLGTATQKQSAQPIKYSDFVQQIDDGAIKQVTIQGNQLHGTLSNGQPFTTVKPPEDPTLVQRLENKHIDFDAQPADDGSFNFVSILISWFPMLLLIGVWVFFLRQMQAGGGKAMGFGKSRAKLLTERQGRVTFEDVAGVDEAKDDLKEIVDFLKDPQKFQRLGGRIPKGVLLVGPPGTGKTLLARAIAGEANVPFFTISGSDFVEMFVGVGASRVRDMFEQAKKNAPCIVFIDEIDAVGRHRGAGLGGGNDEREQTLNQLLVEMDGFETNEGVILIAATNRPDVLDPALLRPGRFDREIVVPNPDLGGREKILRVHMRKVPLGPDVDPRTIARGTPGFSGADLANLINEAALLAARRGKRVVSMAELEDAKDKVMMGSERRSMAMTEDEKKLVAYHEAGHALVGMNMPQHDPLHKVTIIPRGRALGLTMSLPERDRHGYTKQYCISNLASMFGGREAEVLIFGEDNVTNGATSDIQQATRMARAMVMEWGMSEKLGRVRYRGNEQEVFLGHSVAQSVNVSPETARVIDDEIRTLIENAEQTARRILNEKRNDLETIAQGLLEYETLSGEEIAALLKGIQPVRTPYEEPEPQRGPGPSVPAAGRPRSGPGLITPEPQPGR
jgi:cell division protease FtsH